MNNRYEFSLKGRQRLAEPYHFTAAGLPNVYLTSGVKIEHDADYGKLVTIDKLPALFAAIAFALVAKEGTLTGDEMRFLRKRIEATQAELGQQLRVTEQTVANYEKGKTEPGPADTALRLLYLAHMRDDDDTAINLRLQAEELMRPSKRAAASNKPTPWMSAPLRGFGSSA